ncbi:MAG: ABC transporter permease [Bacteroidia bacterium]|nr:ABC transporter permease [Bacteroidia bacterium]
MNKIWVILKREYLTRVKNKTFIIMTFLGPLLIALLYGGIILVATKDASDKTPRNVLYNDESGFFNNKLDSVMNFHFVKAPENRETALKKVSSGEFYALMEIKDKNISDLDSVQWISRKTLSLLQKEKVSDLLVNKVYSNKLKQSGLSQGMIDSLKPSTKVSMLEIDETGGIKSSSSGIKSGIGFALAMIVYMFIFLYGSMVMRSALEEKTNRIVEVIVSSVKPFQMMLGKILGVALVGLTQFAAWIVLSIIGVITITTLFGEKIASTVAKAPVAPGGGSQMAAEQFQQSGMMDMLYNLPHLQIITIFLIYFTCGFLLYSSMFAAIGAAVNQETDVQQFMMPISLPLIFGFFIAQSAVFQDPHGPMATIFSIIPFTSPVVMVVRSPFGVPISELLLSIGLLLATFIFMVWITGRIYRIGILMYGKKPTWKQLGKWIFIKD